VFIEAAKAILLVVSALFPIVDPIGGAPIFLSLTTNYDAKARRLLARRIAVNSFILIMARSLSERMCSPFLVSHFPWYRWAAG
jgi:multiple antibiotic resistance protein